MAQNFAKISKGINFKGQSSAPSSPDNGDLYYDSTRNTPSEYINGFWFDHASKTDVASAASLTSTQFTATVVQSSLVRITGSTAGSIHGLTASGSAKQILLYNESSATQTLKNQSGTEGTAANRITTPTGGDISVLAGQSALLVYDLSATTWVVTAYIPAASPLVTNAKTAAYTTTPSDNFIKFDMSGSSNASYAVTLHTAVGNAGQQLMFEITAGTGTLSVNTTSSQTVGTLNSGVWAFHSIGNSMMVISDGTNWQVMIRPYIEPKVTTFTTVGSSTFTTQVGPTQIPSKSLRVLLAGGGGGGGGGGTAGSDGSTGSNSTFGSSLVTSNGGAGGGGAGSNGNAGTGGTASLGTGAVGVAVTGSNGVSSSGTNSNGTSNDKRGGGDGGDTPYFSGGGRGIYLAAGSVGVTNTGAGGAGGYAENVNASASFPGGGGGSGGFCEAIIGFPQNIASSFTVVIGDGGGGGAAGGTGNGTSGGKGAAGVCVVIETF